MNLPLGVIIASIFLISTPIRAAQLFLLEQAGQSESKNAIFDIVKDINEDGKIIVGSLTGKDDLPQPSEWRLENEAYQLSMLDLVGTKGAALAIGKPDSYALAKMSSTGGLPQLMFWSKQKNRLIQRAIGVAGQVNITAMTNDDEPRLVGSQQQRAFVWSLKDGLRSLPYENSNALGSEAVAIDAAGEKVAGSISGLGFQKAVVWQISDQDARPQDLPYFDPRLPFAKIAAISADGQILAGTVMTERGLRAAIWSGASRPELLPAPENTIAAYATDLSADGKKVLGQVKFYDPSGKLRESSFIWQEEPGFQLIEDLLPTEAGNKLRSWSLLQAELISADGSTIAGTAKDARQQRILWAIRI